MGMFVSHQWMKEGGKVRLFKGHGGIAGGSCSPNLRMRLPNQESRTEGGWIVSTYQTITVTVICHQGSAAEVYSQCLSFSLNAISKWSWLQNFI